MITIRKLKTLKPGTLRRKIAVILQAFENDLAAQRTVDLVYLDSFLDLASGAFDSSMKVVESVSELQRELAAADPLILLRRLNRLRHLVLAELGTEPADWDMQSVRSPVNLAAGRRVERRKGVSVEVFLDDIRSPFNLGSIFRTSDAFGVDRLMLSPDCPDPKHPRTERTSMGCTDIVEWTRISGDEVFNDESVQSGRKILFALELGGTPLADFKFPDNGIAVIGSEELGISPEAREAVMNSGGLVSIPVFGLKGSINVSVAFGIMMQRWSERLY